MQNANLFNICIQKKKKEKYSQQSDLLINEIEINPLE